jgi:hypothetical protein
VIRVRIETVKENEEKIPVGIYQQRFVRRKEDGRISTLGQVK